MADTSETIRLDIVGNRHFRHGSVIDVEHAVQHLDAIARQTDQALDVVLQVVRRILVRHFEDNDIAARRFGREHAARYRRQAEWEGVLAVAVREFLDEEIVADQ